MARTVTDRHSKNDVYEWEHTFHDWNIQSATRSECALAVRVACQRYKVKPVPKVKRWNQKFCWCPDKKKKRPVIWLNRDGLNLATSLHEAAHWIVVVRAPKHVGHGPVWLGVYLDLLEEAGIAPRAALTASARAAGLRWRRLKPKKFTRLISSQRRRSSRPRV